MYYISMTIAILATVLYNVSQKSINESANPAISMLATYLVAITAAAIALFFMPLSEEKGFINSFKELNWASYALGLAAFGLEIGFLYVYRSGWNLAVAPLFTSIVTTMILLVIGLLVYKDKITLINGLGIFLSLVGLVLMNKK